MKTFSRTAALATIAACFLAGVTQAATYSWSYWGTTNYLAQWNASANWGGSGYPNADSDIASFHRTLGSAPAMYIDLGNSETIIGNIAMTESTGSRMIFIAGKTLVFKNGANNAYMSWDKSGGYALSREVWADMKLDATLVLTARMQRVVYLGGIISGQGGLQIRHSATAGSSSAMSNHYLWISSSSASGNYPTNGGVVWGPPPPTGRNTYSGGTWYYGDSATDGKEHLVLNKEGALGTGNVWIDPNGDMMITATAGTEDRISDSASLYLNSTASARSTLLLLNGVDEKINKLYINGVQVSAGTWGSSTSAAEHKDDNFFAGSGMLDVSSVPNTITSWKLNPTDNKFSTAGNWDGGSPVNTNEIIFGATSLSTLVQGISGLTLMGIDFNSSAPAYTIAGATTMTILDYIKVNSASKQTLDMLTTFSTFTNAIPKVTVVSGGTLVFGSTGTAYAHTLDQNTIFTGGGEVNVLSSSSGSYKIGPPIPTTLDMSGLGTYAANVGTLTLGGEADNAAATVNLGASNRIVASTITLGFPAGSYSSANGTLRLGLTNIIQVNAINLGGKRSNTGTINFNAAGSIAYITGKAGDASNAEMTLGNENTSGGSFTPTGNMDFSGGTVIAQISTQTLGTVTAGNYSSVGGPSGTFTMDGLNSVVNVLLVRMGFWGGNYTDTGNTTSKGTLVIKNGKMTVQRLRVADKGTSGNAGNAYNYSVGLVNICGGTLVVSNSFVLGDHKIYGTSASQCVATLLLTNAGGTLVVCTNIYTSTNATADATTTITLNGGTLDMGGDGTPHAIGSLVGQIDTLNFESGTLKNVAEINGGTNITKTTTGTLILDGVNTYSGVTTISGGSIKLGNGAALGSTASGTVVSNGCSIDLNGNAVGNEAFAIIGVGTGGNGALVNKSATAASLSGSVELAAAATIGCTNALSTFTISGIISGSGALTKNGSGTVVLSGINTYSGVTTISGGSMRLGNAAALGTTAGGTVVNSGCSIDLNGYTVENEAITISGTGTAGNGALVNKSATEALLSGPVTLAAAATIGCTNALSSFTISGIISGSGALTKNGDGTLVLNNANTYGSATTVSKGTLAGTGSVANSAVEIKSGARVSPGVAGVANFGTGTLKMDKGSTYDWQYSSTTSDVMRTAGLTLATEEESTHSVTVKVTKTSADVAYPLTRTLFTFSAGTAPSANALYVDMTAVPGLQPPTLKVTADAVLITIVPEPTGVVCLAALALLLRRR